MEHFLLSEANLLK